MLEDIPLSEASRLEAGLSVMRSKLRPEDAELRIVIFTACYFVLDGVTLTIRRLASHLRSQHATVKIVTTVPSDYKFNDPDVLAVPAIDIPFSDAGSGYAFGSSLAESTIREIERFNPTCVHFTVPDFVALDGIRWCQKNNIPYIGTWHSNYLDYLKYYYLEFVFKFILLSYLHGFYEQIPVIYVPTPYIMGKMEAEGFGKYTKLVEWGRGVDLKLFSPERRSLSFRHSKGIQDTDIVILWVGRLVPEKQPDIWFEVLDRLAQEGYPVKGLVVGNGEYAATLSELPHVKCCGWLSGITLAEAYASSDILLFPSAVETFGNVTSEAMASGCVCVVEELCGNHLVTNNDNGYTCKAGDVEGFYQATKDLVVNNGLRRQMSEKARENSYKFDRNLILQQMAEHYKDAIVRHQDPTYVTNLMKTPMVTGQNFLSSCCCHYYFVKALLNPFMNTANSIKNFHTASSECLKQSRSKLNLGDYLLTSSTDVPQEDSRFEEDPDMRMKSGKRGNSSGFSLNCFNSSNIIRLADLFATIVSYGIVVLLIFAAFLV